MQLYDCQQKAVHDDGEEKEQYGQLTLDFIHELDKRVADAQKELKKHVLERKDRNIGSLLATFPPSDAPK